MTTNRALLLRTALAVRRQLERPPSPPVLSELPAAALDRCQRQLKLLTCTSARSWLAATGACRDRLRWSLNDLRRQVEASLEELQTLPSSILASVRDLYEDLVALDVDFAAVSIDLKERLLAVTTEPIKLEGVFLGRFSIVLEWERLHQGSGCYELVALDPQPAAADSSVSHPHVRDGNLCEGEAWGAIRSALATGRLLDFFTVVARTLATYNPGSAYVSLDQWEGVSCADCGATADEDDRTSCEACDCDVCCDCSAGCNECSRNLCGQCSSACSACRDTYCAGCLVECAACHEPFCGGCLNESVCHTCGEAADQEAALRQAQAHSPPAAAPATAALPLRLGQVAVPA
jgi:hypothetical protein